MREAIIRQCKGDGQGSCRRCEELGKWNRTWMVFLYKIDDREGCYCRDCVNAIVADEYDAMSFEE